jgi:hypothetical protein
LIWIFLALGFGIGAIVYTGKAADDRSAFIRWRPQIQAFWQGRNIWDVEMFPNPPILPIVLSPLVYLPKVTGAVVWYLLKAAMAAASIAMVMAMARTPGERRTPAWVLALVILLSFRPILSDLHHGNNNLLILFLIVGSLWYWRKGHDAAGGMLLALAIAFKITPGLFLFYFMIKRSWKMVGATLAGLVLNILVIPSLLIGPKFNMECLGMWWHRMLRPYVMSGHTGDMEINQSMVGVLSRLLTESRTGGGRYDNLFDLNLVALDPVHVSWLLKGLSLALVMALAWCCRRRAERREDPALLGEWALVALTMLFVSERSWKHHYVTLLLPYAFLVCRMGMAPLSPRIRRGIAFALGLSMVLMLSTSSEVGGLLAGGMGHKLAQGYGMFLWAGVVLYLATAWQLRVEWASRASRLKQRAHMHGTMAAFGPHALRLNSAESHSRNC